MYHFGLKQEILRGTVMKSKSKTVFLVRKGDYLIDVQTAFVWMLVLQQQAVYNVK
jgi:hypothetical protein